MLGWDGRQFGRSTPHEFFALFDGHAWAQSGTDPDAGADGLTDADVAARRRRLNAAIQAAAKSGKA